MISIRAPSTACQLSRDNLVRVLKGRVLVEGRRKLGNRVLVGAMQAETMADYIEPGCLVVLGDREDAQFKAMESGAAALVITGDLLVSERALAAARQKRRPGDQHRPSHIHCRAPDKPEHEHAGYHVPRV